MIKTRKLDKYFNEGKQNSIHVINNTTLEFPNTGLVSLVGQSGSGKTTLLNVISGLDKAKGTIEFDDIVMNKYQSHKWDQIRSHDIGYVFQNYYLLEDRSVYDNIEITLNMIGIVDKEEVDYRIIYVLNAVGMYRYRNKKASDLSGGQKQRVAIARAIAKNPKVIIADEPTGNLDSANSIEVMKIIKKISQERLVVLVTHNMPLANKYSDRIISLADGVVVTDLENELAHQTELSFDDKNIYLGNLNNYTNDENIALYSNNETNDIQFTIVKINNNYFLKPLNDNVRINIIDKNSDIKLINAKKEEVAEDAFETNFSLDELDQVKSVRVKKRTLSFKEAVIAAFKKLFNMGKKAKIQMIALIMLGMMFSSAVHALVSNLVIDSSKVYVDKNVYQVTEIITDLNLDQSKYIQYTNNRSNVMGNVLVFNGRNLDFTIDERYPLGAIKAEKVTNGTYPKNVYEVLIDETVLNSSYANKYEFDVAGIKTAKEFVGQKIVSNGIELTISGTVNTNTKGLYIHDIVMAQVNLKYNNLFPILDTDTVVLSSGRLPNNNLTKLEDVIEIVVPNTEKDVLGEIFTTEEFGNTQFKVVGVFTNEIIDTTYFYNPFFLEQEVIQMLINGLKANSGFYPLVYSLDGKDIEGVKTKNLYTEQVDEIKMMKKVQMSASAIQMAVAIGVSGLIFFFLVRSSLTSRVKEISILRSLGVSKYEVVSLFTVEYFILTAFTSFIGVLIGTVFTNVLYKSFIGEFLGVRVTPISALVAFVGIFITNIVLALIPVGLLLRKTPAAMLTNYDI